MNDLIADSSEYLAECDMRRAYISGFNGSAGTLFFEWIFALVLIDMIRIGSSGCAIVTSTEAFLFTDGRYFLQAEQQLDSYVPFPVISRVRLG